MKKEKCYNKINVSNININHLGNALIGNTFVVLSTQKMLHSTNLMSKDCKLMRESVYITDNMPHMI